MSDYFKSYLQKNGFEKYLKKLKQKLKDQKVVIYGTGTFFQYINSNYDLSGLNVIGVSDIKYSLEQEGNEDLGYKIIPISMIVNYKPDCVLVATENYITILENLASKYFKDTQIKLLPMAKKNILEVIKTIWNSI